MVERAEEVKTIWSGCGEGQEFSPILVLSRERRQKERVVVLNNIPPTQV